MIWTLKRVHFSKTTNLGKYLVGFCDFLGIFLQGGKFASNIHLLFDLSCFVVFCWLDLICKCLFWTFCGMNLSWYIVLIGFALISCLNNPTTIPIKSQAPWYPNKHLTQISNKSTPDRIPTNKSDKQARKKSNKIQKNIETLQNNPTQFPNKSQTSVEPHTNKTPQQSQPPTIPTIQSYANHKPTSNPGRQLLHKSQENPNTIPIKSQIPHGTPTKQSHKNPQQIPTHLESRKTKPTNKTTHLESPTNPNPPKTIPQQSKQF